MGFKLCSKQIKVRLCINKADIHTHTHTQGYKVWTTISNTKRRLKIFENIIRRSDFYFLMSHQCFMKFIDF